MSTRSEATCFCFAYPYPHRFRSGRCGEGEAMADKQDRVWADGKFCQECRFYFAEPAVNYFACEGPPAECPGLERIATNRIYWRT